MKQWVGRRILQRESWGWMSNTQPLSVDDLRLELKHITARSQKKKENKNKQKKKENPPHHVRGTVGQREIEHGGMCIHVGSWPTHLLLMLLHLYISGWFLGWRTLLPVSRLKKKKAVLRGKTVGTDGCYMLWHLPSSSAGWITLELGCVTMLGPRIVNDGVSPLLPTASYRQRSLLLRGLSTPQIMCATFKFIWVLTNKWVPGKWLSAWFFFYRILIYWFLNKI